MPAFAARVTRWQARHGRHGLPWQDTRDAYRIWLSEVMLQQTQVATVIPYYARFLARFPDIAALARAPEDEVLALWSGLGYYSRARNLQRAAQAVVERHGGRFPKDFAEVAALPGIGRSTAAAICAFAFGDRRAILDGNVKRVLARHAGIEGYPGAPAVEKKLWACAEALLPRRGVERYTQGLMDLGALVCTRTKPRCGECPVSADCAAFRRGLTATLPHARPRKALPVRRTVMLVLEHAGEVLLVKRPPTGVWPGLWSLPEVADARAAAGECRARFGVEPGRFAALPEVAHGFSHYRLDIEPRRAGVAQRAARAAEPGALWLTVEEALAAAIPAPVRRILQSL